MSDSENVTQILNDLILINNDRIAGYTRAKEELKPEDGDLSNLFEHYIMQTKKFNTELTSEVVKYGETPEKGTMISGKLHRLWLDVKATFSGHDRKSILEECERGEDASKKAYEEALEDASILPADISNIIRQQAILQKEGHDQIKALRDSS